jgi:hypothetical protein
MIKELFLTTLLMISIGAAAQVGTAPYGEPKKVAADVIAKAEHPCGRVTAAVRTNDGGILAQCSNGERYLIATINGMPFALKCSAARKLGVNAC